MDDSAPIYVQEDQAQLTAIAFSLGEDESQVAETLVNHSDYGGWQQSTDVHVPGLLSHGEAWLFYRDVLQAQDWIVNTVRDGYIFPLEEEVPMTKVLKNNRSA